MRVLWRSKRRERQEDLQGAKQFSLRFELSTDKHKLDGVEKKGGRRRVRVGRGESVHPQSSCFREGSSEP